MEQAAVNAMADRKPAQLFAGSVETEGLNFVKHYVGKSRSTGQYCVIGDCFGDPKHTDILRHTTPVDPTLHVLQFKRQEGKEIVLINFRAHPHFPW